jgi:hypothetical protein
VAATAIVRQGPLKDNLEAFKAHQADPDGVVVLARSDSAPGDPATYRVFARDEPTSPGRFLTLGYDQFFALSLHPSEAPLIFPMGLFAVAAHVEVRVQDPIAYLIAAMRDGDDVFAGLRARIARALEGQTERPADALFAELQALGDALERRIAPFEGLQIVRCRFERMEAALAPPAPAHADEEVLAAREATGRAAVGRRYAARRRSGPDEGATFGNVGDISADRAMDPFSPGEQASPLKKRSKPQALVADASAFAPRRFRRETTELVQVLVHRPKDKAQARKAALAADREAIGASADAKLGALAVGTQIEVALDAAGARVKALAGPQRWDGEILTFAFAIEVEAEALGQIVCAARVLADGAQIGVIAFARPVAKGDTWADKPAPVDAKMRRARRVFLSYSGGDREKVAMIADAYARAGVPCFFDRTSLTGGEEWSPRLYKEIERSDLFHLFWSQSAARSEWVAQETRHALKRRRGSFAKRPDITIQMLDGPPWAPHPADLDALNFDDFTRAAIVGYARGAG